jgi:hypothetical protein
MSPLGRYWIVPCCQKVERITNDNDPGYLRNLTDSIYQIRNLVRNSAHLKRIRKYKIVCPNRIIGMGERRNDPLIEELREVADRWDAVAVHPASDIYKLMAGLLDEIMEPPESSYSNSGMPLGSGLKRPRRDLADHRQ